MNLEDELVYRSSVAPLQVTSHEEYVRDEAEYSSILEVKKLLSEALEGLYKDFNAFSLSSGALPIEVQIAARQEAHRIIAPLFESINGVAQRIAAKNRK